MNPTKKITITVPAELALAMQRHLEPRGQTRFITSAISHELKRHRSGLSRKELEENDESSCFYCLTNFFEERERREPNLTQEYETVAVCIDDAVLAKNDLLPIIEPMISSIDIYGTWEEYETSLMAFTPLQRAFVAIFWYIAEVNNGGHDQFYHNATGIVWPEALEGFRLIGFTDGVRILSESAAKFGTPPPRDRSERQELMSKLELEFEGLDNSLFATLRETDLDALMLRLARVYPEKMRFSGTIKRPRKKG